LIFPPKFQGINRQQQQQAEFPIKGKKVVEFLITDSFRAQKVRSNCTIFIEI
jgi:hypothetical protein